jgi:hypothetical protein
MNVGRDLRESLRRAAATAPSETGAWERFERRLRRRRATRTWTAGAGLAVAVVLALVVAGPNLQGPSDSGAGGGGGMGLAAAPDTFVALTRYPLGRGLSRYDARTGRHVQANPAGESGLSTFALGPDGLLLLAQSSPAGRCETTLDQLDWHGARIWRGSVAMREVLTTMAIAPDGHLVALAGRTCAGRLAVAVVPLGEDRLVPRVLVEVPRPASSLSFSSDGRQLGFVTGARGARYTAHVLDTTSPPGRYDQLPAFQPVAPGCGYRAVAFGQDSARLLAATTCQSKQRSVLADLDVRSGRAAPVRTAPGQVATLDFDAGRGHVLMQMVTPADPLVPVPLFRWDRHSAPKRIPVAAGVTSAQW